MIAWLRWSSLVYGNLLRVCPKELRRDFGDEMTLVFCDDLRAAWRNAGMLGVVRVWLGATGELVPIGLSTACAAHGLLACVISCVISAMCLGGELALARAHAPAGIEMIPLAEAIQTVVMWPSLVSALVAWVAVCAGARSAPLSLAAREAEPLA